MLINRKKILIVFLLFVLLSLPYFVEICSGYMSYSYLDREEFILWDYVATNKNVAFGKIFYPYGLLNYYKNYNIVMTVLYYLISPLLFTIIFFLICKVTTRRIMQIFSISAVYIFATLTIGFQIFARYGILVVGSLLFVLFLRKKQRSKKKILFIFGILSGLIFSLISDIGSYLALCFVLLNLFDKLQNFKNNNIFLIIFEILTLIVGFIVGFFPFFVFLLINGGLDTYITYFQDVKEIVLVAKTPFFAFIDSPANVFTLFILFCSIYYIATLIAKKTKLILLDYFIVSLITSILLMEQKSIIRSIDRQIAFVSLLLLMFLMLRVYKTIDNKRPYLYIFIISLVCMIYLLITGIREIDLQNIRINMLNVYNNACFDNNLKKFHELNPDYQSVIVYLESNPKFNGKVASLPTGNSVFYVLLDQIPPRYNAIFEGSTEVKQKKMIEYIKLNNIDYITLNTNPNVVQDGVPDFLRQTELYKFIILNYAPETVIGDHLILRKNEDKDFFASNILGVNKYDKYLLEVDLNKIPYSEGYYKYHHLIKTSNLIVKDNLRSINKFIDKKTLFSKNKVLVFIPHNTIEESSFIKFYSEVSNAVVYFSCKKGTPCLINLSNIPLFYKDRQINKIEFGKTLTGKIEIYENINDNKIW